MLCAVGDDEQRATDVVGTDAQLVVLAVGEGLESMDSEPCIWIM